MTEPTEPTLDPIEVSPEELSTNYYWTYGHKEQFNIQSTVRGNPSGPEISEHIDSLIAHMTEVVARGGHARRVDTKGTDAALTSVVTTPTQAAIETGKAVPPPPPPAPNNGNGGAPQESQCVLIKVGESYTAKKPQLQFEVNGREHPLTYTKSVADMAKLLAPIGFTAAHIVVGQKYSVNCIVTWRMGEKYPDVLSVRPA